MLTFIFSRRTVEILRHRDRRLRERITSLEGADIIRRAVEAGIKIKTVYFSTTGSKGSRIRQEELPFRELTKMGTKFYNLDRDQLLSMCGATDTTVVGIISQSY